MTFYTNTLRDDGFGGQFQGLLWTILFLEYNNLQFVYTNIKEMEHNYKKDPLFLDKIETYMAIKNNYMNIKEVDNNCEVLTFPNDYIYRFIESNIDLCHSHQVIYKFKKFFYEGKKTPFNTTYFNVAIHIRRQNSADPCDNSIMDCRITPLEYFINIIHQIYKDNSSKNIKFHIYSQGSIEDFQEIVDLTQYNIEFHLNEFVLDTFNSLVFADGLITSGSSFSYIAAILNRGIVYYKCFWHKPANHWVIGDNIPQTA